MIIDLKRSIDGRWLFDPLSFILRWSCLSWNRAGSHDSLLEGAPVSVRWVGQSINFQEDVNKLEGLSIESQEYEEIIEELKKSVCNKVVVVVVVVVVASLLSQLWPVCNKEEHGFCCSTIEPNGITAPQRNKCCGWVASSFLLPATFARFLGVMPPPLGSFFYV